MSQTPHPPAPPHGHHPDAHLHRFGQRRPSRDKPDSQASPVFAGSPFQPLPAPTGKPPYRLDLAAIVPDAVAAMHKAGGMALHMVGDTGGVQDPNPQTLVAAGLEHDASVAGPYGTPAFFYHLGDVVYFDGQAEQYLPQFYDPYAHYPRPMLGIPGNHDGDILDDGKRTNPLPSLATFVRNFCAPTPGLKSPDSGEVDRTAMIQPNVYFTLLTPFATFVGLYTNVPEGGVVEADQAAWFEGELAAAAADKPLIVALHHPPQSLDTYHSGSKTMATLLATSATKAKRQPDLVFSGHVHNYQRFTVADAQGGGVTPTIVAGQGGYHNLHKMVQVNKQPIVTPYKAPNDPGVTLESYYDDRFGFMRLEIGGGHVTVSTYTVPRTQESYQAPPTLFDKFVFDWKARKIVT